QEIARNGRDVLAAGDHHDPTADHAHRPEGDDQGVDVEADHQQAVDQAEAEADAENEGVGEPDRPAPDNGDRAPHAGGEGHDRADRQVDAAGDDDQRHADRHDAD